jgi:cytidylate kinase
MSHGEGSSARAPLIAVVGVCAAGKTTLVEGLRALGYNARQVGQEHSYVPYMWQRITRPDILIYLHASYEVVVRRREVDYDAAYWQEQERRLAHAAAHAHLVIDTDALTPEEVLARAVAFLESRSIGGLAPGRLSDAPAKGGRSPCISSRDMSSAES